MASIKNGSLGPSAAKPLTEMAPPLPYTLEQYRSSCQCLKLKMDRNQRTNLYFNLYATQYFSVSAEGHESGRGSQAGQLSNHRSTHFNHEITGQFVNLLNHSWLIK